MNKVGYLLDDKIKKLEQEDNPVKQKKNEKTAAKYHKIFKRFEDLAQETSICSLRVRMLLLNLIENRSQGWEKTKKQNESGPKKVEDLRKELEKKAREEE